MKKLLLILLLFTCCKKDAQQPAQTPAPKDTWVGTYLRQSETCSLYGYRDASSSSLVITSSTNPCFGPQNFNIYISTDNVCFPINGSSAVIAGFFFTGTGSGWPDAATWKFDGGTATKSGNQITCNYSITVSGFQDGHSETASYVVIYKK